MKYNIAQPDLHAFKKASLKISIIFPKKISNIKYDYSDAVSEQKWFCCDEIILLKFHS